MPSPIRFEIHAGDPERAIAFYTAVFGWSFQRLGDQPYWLVGTGGMDGGLLPRIGDEPDAAAPVTAFIVTLDVADVDATVEAALDAGGSVALPRQAVPGIGWVAYLKDTEGNILGVLQADPTAA
jgi:uncharacterized protein